MKMKRWLWILAAVLISTVVYSTIRYGLRPKPIPVLNATEFENPEQIGAVIYKRLRQNIRPERLIVLGSTADLTSSPYIWLGFLKSASADQIKIDVLFQREGLSLLPGNQPWEVLPYGPAAVASGELQKQVQQHLQAGHMVVVHGLTGEVSHLMKDSLSRQLDKIVRHPVLALSTIALSLRTDDIESLQERCLKPSLDDEAVVRLECTEMRVSRTLAKKKPQPGKIWAVMERHGLEEYLVFVHN